MNYFNHPVRKPTRLKSYDYSSAGAYFITICTLNRECVLSDIIDNQIFLTTKGEICEQQIHDLSRRYSSIHIDEYVIMPNHIHMIIIIREPGGANRTFAQTAPRQRTDALQSRAGGASPSPTVSDIIRVFKSQTTRLCDCNGKLFQRSFHDHIIRNEADYHLIKQYIKNNPLNWHSDCFNPAKTDKEI